MRKYTASNPVTGNSSYSYKDQKTADSNLKFLDDNNCTNCDNCTDCRNCNCCTNCHDCRNCNYCTDCKYCHNCKYCDNCDNCKYCKYCTNCDNCINVHSSQDYLILGPAQSSSRMTYAYIDSESKSLMISCGCFTGSLDEFKAKISETHEDSPLYLAQYNAFADCIETTLLHRIPE